MKGMQKGIRDRECRPQSGAQEHALLLGQLQNFVSPAHPAQTRICGVQSRVPALITWCQLQRTAKLAGGFCSFALSSFPLGGVCFRGNGRADSARNGADLRADVQGHECLVKMTIVSPHALPRRIVSSQGRRVHVCILVCTSMLQRAARQVQLHGQTGLHAC